MPNRVVRQDILTSDSVNSLSWPAEVFYRRLMSIVDDYGRGDGRTSILRSSCYPLQLDKVSEADITKWMGECTKAGLVSFYQVEDKPYFEILKFKQSMRIMKSKYPDNPNNEIICKQMNSNDLSIRNETETNQNLKSLSMTDIFLKDFPNSSEFEKISMNVKVSKEDLSKWIVPFKDSTMRLQYKNFIEFAEHFKNWYLKQDKSKVNDNQTGPKKRGR